MKHKTWFRLVLKAIGVLLIGLSVSPLAQILVWIIQSGMQSGDWTLISPYSQTEGVGYLLVHFIPPGLQLAAGIYLLLGGEWLVNKCIRQIASTVPNAGTTCPAHRKARHAPSAASRCRGKKTTDRKARKRPRNLRFEIANLKSAFEARAHRLKR